MSEGAGGGNAGAAVQLGLGLNIAPFLAQLEAAESELGGFIKKIEGGRVVKIRAGIDFDRLESELRHARQLIGATSAEIKVGTSFYKAGSGWAVSKTALLREIIRPLQDNIKDDKKYQIRIGAYIGGDIDADAFIAQAQQKLANKGIEIKVKATLDGNIDTVLKQATASARGLAEAYQAVAAAAAGAAAAAKAVAPPAAPARKAAAPREQAQQTFDASGARQALTQVVTNSRSQGGFNLPELRELQKAADASGIKTTATGANELRKELAAAFASAADDAIKGLALGLAKGEVQIKNASDEVGKALIAALKKTLGIASPAKETKELGRWSIAGFGLGFIEDAVRWERRMAQAIRQAVGNAVRDGIERDRSAGGVFGKFGAQAGSTIATSLSKALKQGLASSVAPALKGGLLGGAGGAATGGLLGGGGAAAGAVKAAVTPSLLTFNYASVPEKIGMLGKGAASLATGGANEAFNNFLHNSVQSVLDAALSTGGQGALIGAAGVAGVAGMAGLAKGAGGSLAKQTLDAISRKILGIGAKNAIEEVAAIEQAASPLASSTPEAKQLAQIGDPLKKYKVSLTKAQKELLDYALQLDNTAEGTFGEKWQQLGGKFAAKMELTTAQVNALASEIATNPVLDDISSYGNDLGKASERVALAIQNKFKALAANVNATQASLFDSQPPAVAAATSISRGLVSNALIQSRAQAGIAGATGASAAAPIENAGNIMGLLGKAVSQAAKVVLKFAYSLTPGQAKENGEKFGWALIQAAEQFQLLKKETQVLSGKVKLLWTDAAGTTPQHLLPPKPVAGTQLAREQDLQLGGTTGRTPLDFRRPNAYGVTGGKIGPEQAENFDPNFLGAWMSQDRRTLQETLFKPGQWKIVDEVGGVWRRIKTNAELAAEFQQQITDNLRLNANTLRQDRKGRNIAGADLRTYGPGYQAPGVFNPFDPPFYRDSTYVGPSGRYTDRARGSDVPRGKTTLGGVFSGNRTNSYYDGNGGSIPPEGTRWRRAYQGSSALALRNEPVEFFKSFRDADKILAVLSQRFDLVGEAFGRLEAKSQVQIDKNLKGLEVTLRGIKLAFDKGEVSASDYAAALYGFDRANAGLAAQSAEVQNLAEAFRDLGIESNAAIKALNDQRNVSLQYINSIPEEGLNADQLERVQGEKARARNARDIQQASFINDQIRIAQAASGFGGFRGREIGNKTLIDRQQRSELANAIRQLKEYGSQITDAGYSTKTFQDIQRATAAEIRNAELALRVLKDEAKDGERVVLAARNAWGTILDDFQNLLPQLLVFAVAYNLVLQRLMSTPGAVIQAAASFDRLNTSISSYLSATRGIGDASAELSKVRDVAFDLGVGYEKAAKSYLSFAAATQGTTLQGREAEISRTLFTAGRNQGLNGEQLDRAATALTQILSKGRVQAEELRGQLAEQLPGAVQVAARAYGVTTQELYRMVEAGQLASDEFVDRFMKQLVAEGADVNQMAGNFTNVTEQLGVSIQALAASAGQPFLAPLTQALRLVNSVITAIIPVGAPLAAVFTAIGINAVKSALGIKSLTAELKGVAAMALGMGAAQAQASVILGPNGQPVQAPAAPTARQQFAAGAAQAGTGLKDAAMALLTGRGFTEAGKGAKEMAAGVKGAYEASKGLRTAITGALAPALKLYLAFEAINLAVKALSGELTALGPELKRSNVAVNGSNPRSSELNPIQKTLSNLNIAKNIENRNTLFDASAIADNGSKLSQRIQANLGLVRTSSAQIAAIDKKLFDERNKLGQAQTQKERDEIRKRIDNLNEIKKFIDEKLGKKGISASGVRGQIAAQEASIQAVKEVIERNKARGASTFFEEKQLADAEKLLKVLKEQAKEFDNINRIKSISALESRLKSTQDVLGREDVNSPNFAALQQRAVGLQKSISDQQLLPQEQALMEIEARQKLITAQVQKQETISRIKLNRLESEKKLIEANLSLEQTRTRLQESIFNRRAQIARAVGDSVGALQADSQGRQARDAGQQREIAVQSQLIEKEREKSRIEATLQREQIRLQQQQIQIDTQMLEIERVKLMAAMKEKGVSDQLFETYRKTLVTLTATIKAIKEQAGAQSQLLPMLDEQQSRMEGVYDTQQQQLRLQSQINQVTSGGEEVLAGIELQKERINAAEAVSLARTKDINEQIDQAIEKTQAQLDLARANVDAQRERLQMAEELASTEMAALDRLIQMQSTEFDGGLFERMAKFAIIGSKSEADMVSLAERRAQLMKQIKDQQDKQKIAELQIKQKEIEAEKVLLNLKVQQLRLSNEEAKIRLRATASRLRMAFEQQGNTAGVNYIDKFYEKFGFNEARGFNTALGAQAAEFAAGVEAYQGTVKYINEYEQTANSTLDTRASLLRDQIDYTNQLNDATNSLLQLDASEWFAKFLDQSTSLGRVLGAAAQGISEFRQSVSSGLVQGLLGGDGATAISNAGKQFADKLLTSLLDEYVMKPMEKNLFAGLSKLLGFKQPETEQQVIARNSERQAAVAEQTRTAIGTLDQSLSKIGQDLVQGFQSVVAAIAQQPLGGAAQAQANGAVTPPVPPAAAIAAAAAQPIASLAGTPIRGARTNRTRDPDAEATGWDIVVPGGVGGRVSNPFGRMRITGTGFQGSGSGPSGRGYGRWVSGEVEVAGKIFDILLGHFQKINVKRGDVLGPGATIGLQGETGRTFGTHVTTHVNPLRGASVGDAWSVLEKLTRAWETGTIVPASGKPIPVTVTNPPASGPAAAPAVAPATAPAPAPGRAVPLQVVPAAVAPAAPTAVQAPTTATGPSLQGGAGSLFPYNVDLGSLFGGDLAGLRDSMSRFSAGFDSQALNLESFNAAITGTTSAMVKASDAAQRTPSGFQGLNQALGGVVSVLGSIGMGIAGAQQIGKGGTYNTLMGLAGIFGAIGSVAGAFAPGGGLAGLFRANGGPVRSRQPYIVGEQGPELFIPKSNGDILSNPDTMDLFSGTRKNLKAQQAMSKSESSTVPNIGSMQPIEVRTETQVINNVEYVTVEQHRKGMQEAARRGQMLSYQGMQHSVKVRRRLGI